MSKKSEAVSILDKILGKIRLGSDPKHNPEHIDATYRVEALVQDTNNLTDRLRQLEALTNLLTMSTGEDKPIKGHRVRAVIVDDKVVIQRGDGQDHHASYLWSGGDVWI